MSRETESSSSGPQGRGGAAYPSGTPPYGSPAQGDRSEQDPSGAPGADSAPAPSEAETARPEERRTETTMTTRIRINIPGSRPIPPVVLRTPVVGKDKPAEGSAPEAGGASAAPVERPAERTAQQPAPPEPEEPRAEEKPPASDWFAPRKGGTRGGNTPSPAAPAPPATGNGTGPRGGSGTPASGTPVPGGSGSFDVSQALAEGPLGTNPAAYPGQSQGGPNGPGAPAGPAPAAPYSPETTAQSPLPGAPQTSDATGPTGPTGPRPGGTPGQQTPWMGDDTAILTPQSPAPAGEPGGPGGPRPPGQVSGATVTSGVPGGPDRVTMRQDPLRPAGGGPQAPGGFDGGQGFDGPGAPARFPEPLAVPEAAPAPAPPKARKKGRSKLGMLVVLVVVVAAGGYGAGLLMNRSDVPKGTTVLGVDIGGGTRDEAVNTLDAALGKRSLAPVALDVDGKKTDLKPDKSGLTLDTQATVRAAATSDYNPVSVFGSLIGKERVVEPVMPVDEEKLADALKRVAGTSGSSQEGTIKFSPGKATPVYGKAGRTVDVDQSMDTLSESYREQVRTGQPGTVKLPLTAHEPTITQQEVDRMMKDFAEPAMSGIVTIKAGSASIPLGPDVSLPRILGVKAIDGKLVDTYDLKALKELYGTTFDGVLVTRGTGQKTPVTPQDVVGVLRKALLGKTPAERVGVIDTNAD